MRLTLSITICVFGLLGLAFITSNYFGKQRWIVFGLLVSVMLITGGGILTYLNKRRFNRKKKVTEEALKMLRQNKKIDTATLAKQEGLSEVDVRAYIITSQRSGLIPLNADVV